MDGRQGAYPMLLIVLQLLVYYSTQTVRASTDTSGHGLNCTKHWKSWFVPDFILVTWQIPDYLREIPDVRPEINWYRFYNSEALNTGTCSVSKLTSCRCDYLDPNFMCMEFDTDFILNVSIVSELNQSMLYAAEIPVYTDECRDPPPQVNLINAVPINSTCVNVTWRYTSEFPPTCRRSCTVTYKQRVYTLSYTSSKDGTKAVLVREKEPCGSHHVLCGLHPYRDYTVDVQSGCAMEDMAGLTLKGDWSDPTSTIVTTPQDVPSGAPQITPGAFIYTRDDCLHAGTRDIRAFWKDIDPDLKNGLITAIQVDIFEESSQANTRKLQKFILSNNETNIILQSLECTQTYLMQIRASTVRGMSDVTSTVRIPLHSDGTIETVIPTIDEHKLDLVHVTWLVKDAVTFELDHVTVFWCFQDQLKCQGHVNWVTVSATSNTIVLQIPADFTPLNYLFGAAVIYHTPGSTNQISAGITWAKCLYIQSKAPPQPLGVRLGSDGPEGALTILWDNPPCYSRAPAPYVHHFLIRVCDSADNQPFSCSSGLSRSFETGDQDNQYFVHDLDTDNEFVVTMVAVGLNGQTSPPSLAVTGYPHGKDSGWSNYYIIPIALVGILAIVGVVVFLRRVYGRFRKCFKGVHIEDPMILNVTDEHEV